MMSLWPGLFFQPVKRSRSEADLPPPSKKIRKKKSNEDIVLMIAHCRLSANGSPSDEFEVQSLWLSTVVVSVVQVISMDFCQISRFCHGIPMQCCQAILSSVLVDQVFQRITSCICIG